MKYEKSSENVAAGSLENADITEFCQVITECDTVWYTERK